MTSLKNNETIDKLQKHIGVKELIAYYVSSLVGVGILIIPAIAARIAGPASILAWILLALISIPFAITFAKMVILVPDSGGVPAFIEKMLSSNLGKSTGMLLTLTMVIGNPVMGFTTAHYLKAILGFEEYFIPWVAYAFMVLSVTFNFLGVRLSSKLQTYLLFFLILGLMSIMLLSLPKTNFHNM